ncbi:MAG TPA: DUF4177 domain-containing protein [Firmicutes bacterium]|nr:DUF4177 domain-containing protein [Bacillota bacterium]
MAKEYKVEVVTEAGCGTVFLGSAALSIEKVEATLNRLAAENWEMDFMVIEKRRMMLFWVREAAVITFSRERK